MNRNIVVSFCCDLSRTYLCLVIYCMSYLWRGISLQPTWFVAVCVLPPVPAGLPSWGVWAWEWQQCVARRLSIQRRPEPCGSGVPADAFLYPTVFTAKIIAYCHTPAGPFQGTLHKLDSVRYILHFNCSHLWQGAQDHHFLFPRTYRVAQNNVYKLWHEKYYSVIVTTVFIQKQNWCERCPWILDSM
jgi:hypothetical protein